MSDWTDLLPAGAEKPIVLEIQHPMHQKADGPRPGDKIPEMDSRLRADLERLAADPAFDASQKKMLQEVGGDCLSVFFIGAEHWRGKDPTTGKVDPPSREVNITVHLPASVARTPEQEASSTQTVMNWLEASELGKALRRGGQGKISHVSARGRRYDTKKDIGQIVRPEDLQLTIAKK